MEPSNTQFPAIYRKGDDQAPLKKRAFNQQLEEASIKRGMTSEQVYNRETAQGVTGAKTAVHLNPTVKEASENETTLGGPVSGAALAKEKNKKREAKNTAEREKKRR